MFILTEVVLQKVIKDGIRKVSDNPAIIDEIFAQYKMPLLEGVYGSMYVEGIKGWLASTKVPVVQAWAFSATKIPSISIHLGSETDDESKAAIGDIYGSDEFGELIVNPMTVTLDIGIHADKSKDHVLWLYYIVNYILYKEKTALRDMGLQLSTFNANEYNKDSKYMAENIWTRWIRFRCTIQNLINLNEYTTIDEIESEPTYERQ